MYKDIIVLILEVLQQCRVSLQMLRLTVNFIAVTLYFHSNTFFCMPEKGPEHWNNILSKPALTHVHDNEDECKTGILRKDIHWRHW